MPSYRCQLSRRMGSTSLDITFNNKHLHYSATHRPVELIFLFAFLIYHILPVFILRWCGQTVEVELERSTVQHRVNSGEKPRFKVLAVGNQNFQAEAAGIYGYPRSRLKGGRRLCVAQLVIIYWHSKVIKAMEEDCTGNSLQVAASELEATSEHPFLVLLRLASGQALRNTEQLADFLDVPWLVETFPNPALPRGSLWQDPYTGIVLLLHREGSERPLQGVLVLLRLSDSHKEELLPLQRMSLSGKYLRYRHLCWTWPFYRAIPLATCISRTASLLWLRTEGRKWRFDVGVPIMHEMTCPELSALRRL
ncbi:uncharacterized protein EV422DRAFT_508651 [Fimicolochytrium jonesii]|uniref:uncharacterized protein n=1 Tax=Fimicolochytrium jonesii TaxID=1396493 RepID=UPI0022FE4398|nr:uncharacterized protein EV422DRAFT_508651 [Fimicolochytrium jonesii]KAI8817823.1 hypothetical protein EV422DRAFT_508651 [Fimicolochytrium jonesii]